MRARAFHRGRASQILPAAFGLLALAVSAAQAQSAHPTVRDEAAGRPRAAAGRLAGWVYDRTRGVPLRGARVFVGGTSFATETDSLGRYRFDSLPVGIHTVSLTHPRLDSLGAVPPVDTVRVGDGATAWADLDLAAAGAPPPKPGAEREPEGFRLAMAALHEPRPGRSPTRDDGVRVEFVPSLAEQEARLGLRGALRSSPGFAPAALELTRLALLLRDGGSLAEAERALAGVISAGDASPEVWLAQADVEAALGHLEAADGAARAALAAGADRPSALHARAAALLRLAAREAEGGRLYLEALDSLSDGAAPRFLADALPLLSPEELAAWQALPGERARAAWLARFWNLRAARNGISLAELLAEHQRRLAVAHLRYRRTGGRWMPPLGAALAASSDPRLQGPFDERGLVYVRYGEPDEVVRTLAEGVRPNESWVYSRVEGGRRVFHFGHLQGASDFRLVSDIFELLDPAPRAFDRDLVVHWLSSEKGMETLRQLLEERARFEPAYATMLSALERAAREVQDVKAPTPEQVFAVLQRSGTGLLPDIAAIDARSRELDLQVGRVTRESLAGGSYVAPAERELPFHYDLLAFRGPGGRVELTAALAIPAARLTPQPSGQATLYAPRISVVAFDSAADRFERLDTTLVFRSRGRLADSDLLNAHVRLVLPRLAAGTHRITVRDALAEHEARTSYGGPLVVPDLTGDRLALSDIAFALPDGGGTWTRGPVSLTLLPPRRVPAKRPFTLFYEIYGLPKATRYRTEIRVVAARRLGVWARLRSRLGGSPVGIALRFDGEAEHAMPGVVQELRRITVQMKPGWYRLRVRVTNLETGVDAASERAFEVF